MACNYRFFLNDGQGNSGKTAGELKACCQADNTGTDNCDVQLRRDGDFLTVLQVIVEMPALADHNSQAVLGISYQSA
ncbi:hypothetical protein [Tunturiibacter gelidiferens]|uniref:hypothetical protein n=1 Tax=Tunturiibacter gelidiferens TaxID=3069689 RepID=UPI003D9AE5E9